MKFLLAQFFNITRYTINCLQIILFPAYKSAQIPNTAFQHFHNNQNYLFDRLRINYYTEAAKNLFQRLFTFLRFFFNIRRFFSTFLFVLCSIHAVANSPDIKHWFLLTLNVFLSFSVCPKSRPTNDISADNTGLVTNG